LRKIAVVTTSRADYGIYLPVLRKIQEEPDLELLLIVSGMHLSPEFGLTVNDIEDDGFDVSAKVEMLLSSDTPDGIAKSMGMGTIGFAQTYARLQPDILLVLGDRFEMHAATVAALPFRIPVAHIHGGEITIGAMDDALRHSMTKLSHFHFVATEEHRDRVLQMGEEPWRVVVSGAPSLDNLSSFELLDPDELETLAGISQSNAPLLVTYHPVTLEYEDTEWQVGHLLDALRRCALPVIFTTPNADTNGRVITKMLEDFAGSYPLAQITESLGTRGYFSLMTHAAAMVGNSSSGIIEAPSFDLPVVNVGTRQEGRTQGINVINAGYDCDQIVEAIKKATNPAFRGSLQGVSNPYGDGHAAERIVEKLKSVPLGGTLIKKRFHEPLPQGAASRTAHSQENAVPN
jgi:UDP-N-acetylglucosamine 2-epimerase (non-hydrolysing)